MTRVLEVRGVVAAIGSVEILHDFNIEVEKGEVVALIGRNGAGKTTLLRTVLGKTKVKSGEILFGGKNGANWSPRCRVAYGVGYMPEDRGLIGTLSVEENIALPLWARGLSRMAARAALEQVWEQMPELRRLRQMRTLNLSGGQQKVVALARALMGANKIVLLDEPFEGVSPALAKRLMVMLGQLREDGTSVLIAQSEREKATLDIDRHVYIGRGRNLSVS